MMTRERPSDFNKRFDIVGCFVQLDGKFILLHRHPHKASGDAWGLPAGKVEQEESVHTAVIREVAEETGIALSLSDIIYFDSFFVRDETFDIEWHMFSTTLDTKPEVIINLHEHSGFRWTTPQESLQMKLIHDLPESIKIFYDV